MTHYRDWTHDPHVPVHDAEPCGNRDPRGGERCTRAKDHTGRHHYAWRHIDPGRVRAVWD